MVGPSSSNFCLDQVLVLTSLGDTQVDTADVLDIVRRTPLVVDAG